MSDAITSGSHGKSGRSAVRPTGQIKLAPGKPTDEKLQDILAPFFGPICTPISPTQHVTYSVEDMYVYVEPQNALAFTVSDVQFTMTKYSTNNGPAAMWTISGYVTSNGWQASKMQLVNQFPTQDMLFNVNMFDGTGALLLTQSWYVQVLCTTKNDPQSILTTFGTQYVYLFDIVKSASIELVSEQFLDSCP